MISITRKDIKQKELDDLKIFMKQIYNPIYYNTKPKYKKPMSEIEIRDLKKLMHKLYNPKLKKRFDWREFGIKDLMAEA